MNIADTLRESALGSCSLVLQILLILIPVMILLQIINELGIASRLSSVLGRVTRLFAMSDEAAIPLMVGTVFGITYGAGVIIDSSSSGRLTKQECFALGVFLSLCHALIEDTLLFAALGASALILVVGRVILAFLLTLVVVKWQAKGVHSPAVEDAQHPARTNAS